MFDSPPDLDVATIVPHDIMRDVTEHVAKVEPLTVRLTRYDRPLTEIDDYENEEKTQVSGKIACHMIASMLERVGELQRDRSTVWGWMDVLGGPRLVVDDEEMKAIFLPKNLAEHRKKYPDDWPIKEWRWYSLSTETKGEPLP